MTLQDSNASRQHSWPQALCVDVRLLCELQTCLHKLVATVTSVCRNSVMLWRASCCPPCVHCFVHKRVYETTHVCETIHVYAKTYMGMRKPYMCMRNNTCVCENHTCVCENHTCVCENNTCVCEHNTCVCKTTHEYAKPYMCMRKPHTRKQRLKLKLHSLT